MRPFVFAADLPQTCIEIGDKKFHVEIARTNEAQERGLQYRTRLEANRGMIFPYDKPQVLNFWMKDCKIPLDILFFQGGKLIHYTDSAPACLEPASVRPENSQCPAYGSLYPADLVVELKAGTRQQYDWKTATVLKTCSGDPWNPSP